MRRSRSFRAGALLAACCAALSLALAPAALGKGRIDRSFGQNGVVDLGADLFRGRSLGAVAVGPGGGIFVTESAYRCGVKGRGCVHDDRLRRYRPDGTPVRGYLSGSHVGSSESGLWLEVDSRGRPLLAWEEPEEHVLIRRLRAAGGIDRRFGKAGTLTLPCRCRLESLEPMAGGGLLVAASREIGSYSHYRALTYVAKLRPDGSGLSRFGGDGFVRVFIPGRSGAAATPGPRGSVLLTSGLCCRESSPDVEFVSRLSPRGRLDHRFGAAYKRSLRGVYGMNGESYGWDWASVSTVGRSRIQVFASTWVEAVMMRLRRDGSRDPSFGRDGVSTLPLDFADAAPDSGGTFVVGYYRGGYQVRRVDNAGRQDRAFGVLPLPDAWNEEGLDIYPQGRGRAIVVARDEAVCRSSCPSDPTMYRVRG